MALIKREFETLLNTYGTEQSGCLSDLLDTSHDMVSRWKNHIVTNEGGASRNMRIDENMIFSYRPESGAERQADITEFAFSQLCHRLGVPPSYISKCIEAGKTRLALENYSAWANDFDKGILVRENDGVVRAVLSDSYSPFDSFQVLRALEYTIPKEYELSAAHLTEDRLHLRFVNYTPLPIDDISPVYAGFTVSSSDVGRGALSIVFFLYRFVCKNGVVMSSAGGVLFKQSHIGSKMTESKLTVFSRAFMNMDKLVKNAVDLIGINSKAILKDYELNMYLEKARRDMKLSEKSMDKLNLLIGEYGSSRMGVINSVAELAQDFSLDTRIDMESWSGNLLSRAV